MNFDQRNRIANARHEIATVISELLDGVGEIHGADVRSLEQAHFQLDEAMKQQKKETRASPVSN
jgi:hypothetical protein